jgi:hypothetical protein
MIERHGGTPAAIGEMLTGALAAFDATRTFAGPAAPAMEEREIISLYQTARKQPLVCINKLHTELQLPHEAPIVQPPDAPGVLQT